MALLHGSASGVQQTLVSLDFMRCGRDRVFQLQHAVQDVDGDGNLSETTLILDSAARRRSPAYSPDGSFDLAAYVVQTAPCEAAATEEAKIPERFCADRKRLGCHCEEQSDPRVKPEGMRSNLRKHTLLRRGAASLRSSQ
jgi:hypothetical protein